MVFCVLGEPGRDQGTGGDGGGVDRPISFASQGPGAGEVDAASLVSGDARLLVGAVLAFTWLKALPWLLVLLVLLVLLGGGIVC